MANIRLCKEFAFEMAHTLSGYDGPCREIHGHSYKLFVTVEGTPNADPSNPKYGMVMDFGDLKRIVRRLIVDRLDHSLVIRATVQNAPLVEMLRKSFGNVHVVDYQPTCENMVARFAESVAAELPAQVKLVSVRLYETATSCAEWIADENR